MILGCLSRDNQWCSGVWGNGFENFGKDDLWLDRVKLHSLAHQEVLSKIQNTKRDC